VYPGLLFTWRRQVRDGVLAPARPAAFVPVRMLEPAQERSAETASAPEEVRTAPSKPGRAAEPIEITLSNGCRLRIDPHVDARALRRIVDVLRG
jgi:transposase